jgi:hypothetical protein
MSIALSRGFNRLFQDYAASKWLRRGSLGDVSWTGAVFR